MNINIQIGDKFTPIKRGRKVTDNNVYTIKDIYITKNSKNKTIDIKYYCETQCLKQVLTWIVPAITIMRGKNNCKQNKG